MAVAWEGDGIILSVRRFGEHDAIVSLLTEHHGRHLGLVKAGGSKRAVLQPGNLVKAWWRARLDDQLGTYNVEGARSFSAEAMTDPLGLAGLASLCAMAEVALPERETHAAVYQHTQALLAHVGASAWPAEYVRWEMALLRDLGYGLDLASCAVTGGTLNLEFVSPRSGRAVSTAGAGPYQSRLLALPAFLAEQGSEAPTADVLAGLKLTAHFLDTHVFRPHRREMPAARARFVEKLGSVTM